MKSSPPLKSIKGVFMKVGFQDMLKGGNWVCSKDLT